jgi:hypothetical protein
MFRDRTIWLIMGLLFGSSLACNAFTGPREPALELPPPPTTVSEATPLADGGGQATVIAPTATLAVEVGNESTDVPNGQAVLTILVDLNVRRGPGVQYDRVGFMLKGEGSGYRLVENRMPFPSQLARVLGFWRRSIYGRRQY